MNSMVIDRRQILQGSSLGIAAAMFPAPAIAALSSLNDRILISACRCQDGGFAIVLFTPSGKIFREIPIRGRGHDFAYHPSSGNIVAFARRPGRFALALHTRRPIQPAVFAPPENRHFYGHGTFSNDGRLLYTTENDFNHARGVIGIYNATESYTRIGELESHGVGPHDILLLADGKTLVVANGGIETHPESGRTKLNLATMQPSLCFIDSVNGDLITRHTLPKSQHRLSIRHLTANTAGTVYFGGQWQDDTATAPGLLGKAGIDSPLTVLESGEENARQLRGYIGSVALSRDGRWLAASAPRAGKIVYINTQSPTRWHQSLFADGCGIAQLQNSRFAVSSGHGLLRHEEPGRASLEQGNFEGLSFDNHMRALF